MNQPQHGLMTTYTNWSCRCDSCRAANAAYMAKRRKVRAAELVKPQDTGPTVTNNSKIRGGGAFQQGFKSLQEAEAAAVQVASHDDVKWVSMIAIVTLIKTDSSPFGETLGYIVVSDLT